MSTNEVVIRALNQATKDWVRHVLGECDPEACAGTHDAAWHEANERFARKYGPKEG